jgi:hypothetical protein
MSADGFYQFLAAFLRRQLKIMFLLATVKSHTDSKNPSSNPLQGACSGFPIAACDSKSLSESRCHVIQKIIPKAVYKKP